VDYKFVLGALDDDILRAKAKYKDLLGKIDIDKINNAFEQPCALNAMVRALRMMDEKWCAEHSLPEDNDIEERIRELNKKGRLRNPESIKARTFLIEQLKSRGFNASEIAEKLNLSRGTVYKLRCKNIKEDL
ncbi:MAG: HTH domain-containing protein, partial [Candidatus Omnitrophota bacterium]|jgi:DNA-binding NarL/FixJ family response regulator